MTRHQVQDLAEAVAHHRAGRIDDAEKMYREILLAEPRRADVMQYLGLIALARMDTSGAVDCMRKAVAISPHSAISHYNLGLALRQHGDRAGAIASYREALRSAPKLVEAIVELGSALREDGDATGGAEILRGAVALRPDSAEAHLNLGAALLTLGQLPQAEASLRRTLELNADLADAHILLGNLHRQARNFAAAVAAYQRALEIQPGNTAVLINLGNTLQNLGRFKDAQGIFEQARTLLPNSVEIHNNLGNVYFSQGNHAAAIESYRRVIELKPDFGPAYNNLGAALQRTGRIEEATLSYRMAIRHRPEADAYNNLGLARSILGDYRDAREQFRRALELRPDFLGAQKNLLGMLLYDPGVSPEERWTEHENFGRAATSRAVPSLTPPTASREPERRLRIGYVSSDFYLHPVGRNLEPVLEHRDRRAFEVVAYAEVARPDETTARLKGLVDVWRPTVGMFDAEIADRISADGIDILVLLAGHFDHNRFQLAAYRRAPVQVSFHDPGTSGIAAMDYLIADRVLVPRGGSERFSERVVRLPSFYIHAPLDEAPEVGALPAVSSGRVTFGSFNNPAKLNDAVLGLWGEVLRAVPGSRLVLKFKNWFGNGVLRERVLQRLGVDEGRVEFRVGEMEAGEHLGLYKGIDIALDPYPFTGSTTTFEALWMGVPVVTLLGETMAGRWSGSMLRSLKLEELVARDRGEYVRIAAGLAGDLDRLAGLRKTLRERVAASPLCDGRARARQLDRLYRALWRRWCAKT